MGVDFQISGNFNNLERFLNRMKSRPYLNVLDDLGRQGVNALAAATPSDSGKTAASWDYEIHKVNPRLRLFGLIPTLMRVFRLP